MSNILQLLKVSLLCCSLHWPFDLYNLLTLITAVFYSIEVTPYHIETIKIKVLIFFEYFASGCQIFVYLSVMPCNF